LAYYDTHDNKAENRNFASAANLYNAMVTIYCGYGIFYVFLVCRKLYRAMKNVKCGNAAGNGNSVAGLHMFVLLLPLFHRREIHRNRDE